MRLVVLAAMLVPAFAVAKPINLGPRQDRPPQPEPHVVLGPGQVAASRTQESVERVIKSRRGIMRACYQKELHRNPELAGKIVVDFEIDAAGKVTHARMKATTMRNPSVEGCIVRQVRMFRFATATAATRVTYPFYFSRR
jgi:hypothetical protein